VSMTFLRSAVFAIFAIFFSWQECAASPWPGFYLVFGE